MVGIEPKIRIGERIKELRQQANMTQRDLDKASGVDQGQISKIELGAILNPRTTTVSALAQALGVTVESLVGSTERALDADYWAELQANVSRLSGANQALLLSLSRQLGIVREPPPVEASAADAPPPPPAAAASPRRARAKNLSGS